jgi:hypothetical protein
MKNDYLKQFRRMPRVKKLRIINSETLKENPSQMICNNLNFLYGTRNKEAKTLESDSSTTEKGKRTNEQQIICKCNY